MADDDAKARSRRDEQNRRDHEPLADADEVAERRAGSARVVHEVIRLSGEEELRRPAMSLFCSGLAGGLAISVSVLAKAFIAEAIPAGVAWSHLLIAFGYTVGFVIVILGRLQLFTESTITAILPLATRPTWWKLRKTARLWGIVFAANMIGTLLVAVMVETGLIGSPLMREAVLALSREVTGRSFGETITLGVPAGFLIASVPWVLPNARGAEFWVVFLTTWTIGIGGFAHVVAGSTEGWVLWLSGAEPLGTMLGTFLVPALIGNIIGGTGLFALLAHGQVRAELEQERKARAEDEKSRRGSSERSAWRLRWRREGGR